ncbi:hypothetical protein [Streptomyces sp. NPDC127084]
MPGDSAAAVRVCARRPFAGASSEERTADRWGTVEGNVATAQR